jgi:hypothetical protein
MTSSWVGSSGWKGPGPGVGPVHEKGAVSGIEWKPVDIRRASRCRIRAPCMSVICFKSLGRFISGNPFHLLGFPHTEYIGRWS